MKSIASHERRPGRRSNASNLEHQRSRSNDKSPRSKGQGRMTKVQDQKSKVQGPRSKVESRKLNLKF